jgi:hypothetical protein
MNIQFNTKNPFEKMDFKKNFTFFDKQVTGLKPKEYNFSSIFNEKTNKINEITRRTIVKPSMPVLNLKLQYNGRDKIKSLINSQNMDSKLRSMMYGNVGSNAFLRVNQQKGLPMFGDKDGDGVANILDCWPLDKKRQGAKHNIATEYNLQDDNTVQVEYPSEVDVNTETTKTPSKFNVSAVKNKFTDAFKSIQGKGTVPQDVTAAQQVGLSPQQYNDLIRMTIASELSKTRGKKQVGRDVERVLADKQTKLQRTRGVISQQIQGLRGAGAVTAPPIDRTSQILGGTTGQGIQASIHRPSGAGFYATASRFTPTGSVFNRITNPPMYGYSQMGFNISQENKMPIEDRLIMENRMKQQMQAQQAATIVQQPTPVQVPQNIPEQSQYPPPQPRPQYSSSTRPPSADGRVWSESSKRYVTYTRAPYRKPQTGAY